MLDNPKPNGGIDLDRVIADQMATPPVGSPDLGVPGEFDGVVGYYFQRVTDAVITIACPGYTADLLEAKIRALLQEKIRAETGRPE